MYQDLLYNDQIKFYALVLKIIEEKNSGKKYVGQIEFDSQLFMDMSPVPQFKEKAAAPALM